MEHLTWPEFSSVAQTASFSVLAVGSVEQHGPHLPLGADLIVARMFAQAAADRHGALLLPSLPLGVNYMFRDWPGSLGVSPAVLAGYVRGVAEGVGRWTRRLLIVNGHDENQDVLQATARTLAPGFDVIALEWAHVALDEILAISESVHERHAGELLTSLFLYCWPDAVRAELITDSTAPAQGHIADDLHAPVRAFRASAVPFTGRETGVYGQPSLGSAEKGKAVVKAVHARIDEILYEAGWGKRDA